MLDAVFDAPLDRRESCLDAAYAGDVALRGRVEKLLRLCGEADSFFEAAQQAMSSGGAAALAVEKPGDFIGAYRLVEKLGEGGRGRRCLAGAAAFRGGMAAG